MKHLKHPKLSKRTFATFAAADLGVFGAPCADITALCATIATELKSLRVLYVDAEHAAFDNPVHSNLRASGFDAELIDHQVGFNVQHRKAPLLNEDPRSIQWFDNGDQFDLALVNANHFITQHTILFWHPAKLKSVLKRRTHCANCLLVLAENKAQIPDEVVQLLPENVAYSSPSEIDSITHLINTLCPIPVVKSVVLAGGQSTRMGTDKTHLKLHDQPQYLHMHSLVAGIASEAFVSKRSSQRFDSSIETINDRFVGLGPFGAILSAFMTDPNAAWLVVASDLPMVDASLLEELLEARDPSKVATAFLNPATGFADPLCTLYEPRAYPRLLHFLSRGVSCPRKMLINSDVRLVEPSDAEKLFNLNTPDDLQSFLTRQSSGSA